MNVDIYFFPRFQIDTINKSKCSSINITITACTDMHLQAHACPRHCQNIYFCPLLFLLLCKATNDGPEKVCNSFCLPTAQYWFVEHTFLRVRGHGNGNGVGSCAWCLVPAAYVQVCDSLLFAILISTLIWLSLFLFVIYTCDRFLRALPLSALWPDNEHASAPISNIIFQVFTEHTQHRLNRVCTISLSVLL